MPRLLATCGTERLPTYVSYNKQNKQKFNFIITNYQLPDGPVKAGRRWGQRHPQGANLGSNGILKFLSKLKQSAAISPP